MSTWEKVTDETASYTKVEDVTTTYTDVEDATTTWAGLDFLLYLATEGYKEKIMSEGEVEYLIYSRGIELLDYTKVDDATTTYIKVEDK